MKIFVSYYLGDKSAAVGLTECSPTDFAGPIDTHIGSSDVCFDGTNIWVVSGNNARLTKFEPDGTPTNYTDKMGTEDWGSSHLAWDGVNIWGTGKGYESDIGRRVICKMLNGAKQATYPLPIGEDAPTCVAFDCTNIWVTNSTLDGVSIIQSNGTGSATNIIVGDYPHGLAFDGEYMWVSLTGTNEIVKCNLSGAVVGTYSTEIGPRGLAWDGTHMWVTNYGDSSVSKFTSDGVTRDTYAGPSGWKPTHIAFDGTDMYVVDERDDIAFDQVYKVTLSGTVSLCYSRAKVGGSSFTSITSYLAQPCPEPPSPSISPSPSESASPSPSISLSPSPSESVSPSPSIVTFEGGYNTSVEIWSGWDTLEGGFDVSVETVLTNDWLTLEGGFDTSIETVW